MPDFSMFKPTQAAAALGKVSSQQASQISNDVMKAVQGNLQNYRQMAGAQPGQALRTTQKIESDLNNGLQRVNQYASLTGKMPNEEALKAYGLQGTYGDVAGQDTWDTQLKKYSLARSGSGGSGKAAASGGGDTGDASDYTFNVDRGIGFVNAVKAGKTTLADMDEELATRYKYGQLSADQYNQWMYFLHPDKVGQQQAATLAPAGTDRDSYTGVNRYIDPNLG